MEDGWNDELEQAKEVSKELAVMWDESRPGYSISAYHCLYEACHKNMMQNIDINKVGVDAYFSIVENTVKRIMLEVGFEKNVVDTITV